MVAIGSNFFYTVTLPVTLWFLDRGKAGSDRAIDEIKDQGWSLNPGRYVATEVEDLEDEVFEEKLAAAQVELRGLATRAAELEASVDSVLSQLLSR